MVYPSSSYESPFYKCLLSLLVFSCDILIDVKTVQQKNNIEVYEIKDDSSNGLYLAQVGPQAPGNSTTSTEVQYPNNSIVEESSGGIFSFISVGLILSLIFLLMLGGAIGVGIYYYMNTLKRKDREDKTKDGVLFEIKVPRENEIEIGVAEQMFANLYGIGGAESGRISKHLTVNNSISFEIVGLPGQIRFFVYSPKKLADLVEKQILGSYQDAEVSIVDEHNIFHDESSVAFAQLELTDEQYYPIKVAEDFTGDPLANILSTISKMGDNEGVLIQLTLSPAGSGWQKAGRKYVGKVEGNNADPEKKRMNVSQDQLQAISKKTGKIGFETAIRVVGAAPNPEIAKMHVTNVIGAFDQFSNPGVNNLKKTKIKTNDESEFMKNVLYRRMPLKINTVLNVEELAAIYHYPNKEINTPNINWLLSKEVPSAEWVNSDIESRDTIWIGNNIFRGKVSNICFEREDRMRHAYVIGQTGSGKSWMLLRMIMQDIYNGDGVCVMDPHGSLAEMVLERIPPERAEDVIYFNVADYERPFGLNLMDFQSEEDKHRVVNGFIGLLKKMYDPNDQGIVGPILERAVRNAMLTAMSDPASTMVEVVRILTDEKWVKEKWIPLIKDDLVKRYWTDQIAKTTEQQKSETLGYIVSKFDRFVTNMSIRNIIGQSESSFNFREVMDDGKILIINLSKGLIGEENSQFLGLLVVPKLISAALSREDTQEEDRRDFFFYVDEFQNFASDEFASILSEARKYRLSLTMANQYIAQMPDNVRDAVFGNVGSLMVGRVGPEDAEYLEKQFEPTLSSTDILNQPNIHYYIKMLTDGKYSTPFSLDPKYGSHYPESGFDLPVDKGVADLIKKLSRLKYGRDVNIVTEEISQRAELAVKPDDQADNKSSPPPLSLK